MTLTYNVETQSIKNSTLYVACTVSNNGKLEIVNNRVTKLIIECKGLEEARKMQKYCLSNNFVYVYVFTSLPIYSTIEYYSKVITRETHPEYYDE